MNYQDIKAMSNEELAAELAEAREAMTRLNLDHAVKGLENPLEIRNVRRAVAQMNTEVRARELAEGGDAVWNKRDKIRRRRKSNK